MYSVPWRLIGETVLVTICAGRVVIRHAGEVVADHAVCPGRRQRITDRTHFAGVAGADGPVRRPSPAPVLPAPALSDRKSVVEGKRVSVRVDLGGRRNIKKTKTYQTKTK